MKRNLYRMGITTLRQIAEYPLTSLKKRFGIMGEQLYWHAWGIDLSPVFGDFTHTENDSYGHGISLLKDYSREDTLICILELCEERSEEHTSELQSRFDLVCRLLLEKKKD